MIWRTTPARSADDLHLNYCTGSATEGCIKAARVCRVCRAHLYSEYCHAQRRCQISQYSTAMSRVASLDHSMSQLAMPTLLHLPSSSCRHGVRMRGSVAQPGMPCLPEYYDSTFVEGTSSVSARRCIGHNQPTVVTFASWTFHLHQGGHQHALACGSSAFRPEICCCQIMEPTISSWPSI